MVLTLSIGHGNIITFFYDHGKIMNISNVCVDIVIVSSSNGNIIEINCNHGESVNFSLGMLDIGIDS